MKKEFNYDTARSSAESVKIALRGTALFAIPCIVAWFYAPAIRMETLVVFSAACVINLLVVASKQMKYRRFKMSGPIVVDNNGFSFNVKVRGVDERRSIAFTEITAVSNTGRIPTFQITSTGGKYLFRKACFDSDAKYKDFVNIVNNKALR